MVRVVIQHSATCSRALLFCTCLVLLQVRHCAWRVTSGPFYQIQRLSHPPCPSWCSPHGDGEIRRVTLTLCLRVWTRNTAASSLTLPFLRIQQPPHLQPSHCIDVFLARRMHCTGASLSVVFENWRKKGSHVKTYSLRWLCVCLCTAHLRPHTPSKIQEQDRNHFYVPWIFRTRAVIFFSKLYYFIFGYFDPINSCFDNKNK